VTHPLTPDVNLATLDMGAALQLLAWSGQALPNIHQAGSHAWLQAVVDALCDLSSRDPLTGLANRRQFDLTLAREADRVTRVGEPALVLLVDVDRFKLVNDTHGHAVGDGVMQSVAGVLMDCVRPMDTVVRLGGDEFAIVIPNCRPVFGRNVAERIRSHIEQAKITLPPAPGVKAAHTLSVTVSLGGAYAPPWVRTAPKLWLERADQQLYLAKAQGRNSVCLEQPMALLSAAQKRAVAKDFSMSGY
jgi:diguanylate cyclase